MKMRIVCSLFTMLLAVPLANAAIYISPAGATVSNADNNRPGTKTIDGSGLSDASIVATGATVTNMPTGHGTDSGDMWRTASGFDWSGAGGAVITYTLGAAYDLTGMHVWNYNEFWSVSQAQRGVKNVKIEYQAGDTNWMTYADDMELYQASASSSYTGTNYTFSSMLEGVTSVRFTCLTNWAEDSTDRIGLSEVRFIAEETEQPLAPVAQQIWMNGTSASLYWDVGAGATGYLVKRSETSGADYVTIASLGVTNRFVNSNLVAGTTYHYVIVGENTAGEGSASSELFGTATEYTIISDGGGTWGNSIYTLPEAVFDGDISTFYDGANSGAWAGVDLGEGNERACPGIDFYPRASHPSRMEGAQFQGSNDGIDWITLAIISETPAVAWNRVYTGSTEAYRYYRCYGVDYGNMAELSFLTTSDVDDVIYTASPVDGTNDVAVDAGIVVTATDISATLSTLIDHYEMLVNSNAVSGVSLNSASGITTFAYTDTLEYDASYSVALTVYRTDGVTNSVEFLFTTIPDYFGGDYLIAPGIRNGGFELVDGAVSNASTVTEFSQIDCWTELVATNSSCSTRYDESAPEGARYLRTQRKMKIINLTGHVIAAGDSFEFKWEHFSRPAGVIVGLCYSNAVSGVTNIVDSEVTVPDNTSIYHEWSGSYTFSAGDPAIGSVLGLMIQENPMTEGETTTTEGCVDKVRLYIAPGPTSAPVIQSISISGDVVMLYWTDDGKGTYTIQRKTNLSDGSWTDVLTGLPAGLGVTNVTASGADQEFFQIRGE